VRVGAQPLGRRDDQRLGGGRGDVPGPDARDRPRACGGELERPELCLLPAAAPGEQRGAPERRETPDQPVNFGPLLALVVDMMKCVRWTIVVTWARLSGSSNGPATGDLPARRRIHAAWRASTEWIASAEAR